MGPGGRRSVLRDNEDWALRKAYSATNCLIATSEGADPAWRLLGQLRPSLPMIARGILVLWEYGGTVRLLTMTP